MNVRNMLYLMKTNQSVRVIYTDKRGKTYTIIGKAFKALNTCIDIGIAENSVEMFFSDSGELVLCVSGEKETCSLKGCVGCAIRRYVCNV